MNTKATTRRDPRSVHALEQQSDQAPVTVALGARLNRRRSLAVIGSGTFGFLLTLRPLITPRPAGAYNLCECQTWLPYSYACVDHTLYMLGWYADCHNLSYACSDFTAIAIGCC
jgi:endo-1,4-beta-D-glucanase Y